MSSIIGARYLKILNNIFSKILIAFCCSLTQTPAYNIQMYLFDLFVVTKICFNFIVFLMAKKGKLINGEDLISFMREKIFPKVKCLVPCIRHWRVTQYKEIYSIEKRINKS